MARINLKNLVGLLFFLPFILSENEHRLCYTRFGNCDILMPLAYKRIWRVPDEQTCVDFCASEKTACLGLVFENSFMICNLYNVSLNSPNVIAAPAFRNTYYQLNNTDCIAGYTGTPPIVTTTTRRPKLTVPSTTTAPPIPIPVDVTPGASDAGATTPLPAKSTLTTLALLESTTASVLNGGASNCGTGSQSILLGYGTQTLTGVTAQATSTDVTDPSSCVTACQGNKDVKGNSIKCQSFFFDSSKSTCSFFADKPAPDGKGTLGKDPTTTTFVQSCIPATVSPKCKNALLPAIVDMSLNAHVKKDLKNIASISTCIGNCLTETSFQCQSINYFQDKKQCQLNDGNSVSAKPEEFAITPQSVYVENTCSLSRSILKAERLAIEKDKEIFKEQFAKFEAEQENANFEPWTSWTSCFQDGKEPSVRVRIRLCKGKTLNCDGKKVDHELCV